MNADLNVKKALGLSVICLPVRLFLMIGAQLTNVITDAWQFTRESFY